MQDKASYVMLDLREGDDKEILFRRILAQHSRRGNVRNVMLSLIEHNGCSVIPCATPSLFLLILRVSSGLDGIDILYRII